MTQSFSIEIKIHQKKAKVVTRSTIASLGTSVSETSEVKDRKTLFTSQIEAIIGNYAHATITNVEGDMLGNNIYDNIFEDQNDESNLVEYQELDENGEFVTVPATLDDLNSSESPVKEEGDKHIGVSLTLPHKGELKQGKIVRRKRNYDGTLTGTHHPNPLLDTRVYEVDFGDGNYFDYSANIITENLYQQVDNSGSYIFKSIVDHRKTESAISKGEGWIKIQSGQNRRLITTKGWDIKIEWSDGTQSWVPLRDLKESNPIQLAEYAYMKELQDEPAFAWWVAHCIKRRDRVIKQIRHRMIKKAIKFGINVPSTVEEALKFDAENGDDLWFQAIEKELRNVRVAFKRLEEGERPPPGSKLIPYHIIFDVKFDLTRKARLVAGGHRNKDVPTYQVFSTVASRESVRLGFVLASLNELEIMAGDISNAYLNALNREKVHVKCGKELFGEEYQGCIAIVVRALYGLKSASASWRDHFAVAIREDLGYIPCVADHDVYYKPKIKPDGSEYYAYLIIYVDDILSIDLDPGKVIEEINQIFQVKEGSVNFPKMYLGTDVRKWTVQSVEGISSQCYALGSSSYIKEAIKVAKGNCSKYGMKFPVGKKTAGAPFTSTSYRPELDISMFCNSEQTTFYQNLIGVLRWSIELGRIDILYEVSILSQYMASPRMGHLTQLLNIFHYLDKHDRSWMVMDPSRFDVEWKPIKDEASLKVRAEIMRQIYYDAEDELPPKMPKPRGKAVDISCFVDSDHAGNRVTRRSHTGALLMINSAPVTWLSRKQTVVESSTFGAEFIALKTALDLVEALVYKLRMLGVPIDGEARVFCDNEAVVKSGSFPEITLKKKTSSIAFNKVREAIAASKIILYFENGSSNISDLFTKVLPKERRRKLIRCILS